jgi:50S ribosomal protein L16 3-hydroxylase
MIPHSATLLGGLSPATFLDEYWQKKPLLVRGAIPGFECPVTPETLVDLSHDEDVASRIVVEKGGDYPWQLEHGPFDEELYQALPESHWTLLVQEVDRHVPDVARLLESFRFIPNWRVDDIMISYAANDGGVGAHIDNYDVFLLQGSGRRKWQIASTPVSSESLVPDMDVRILADFEPDQEWILDPGDMLYLPPRIAHNGIAMGECITLSIGFRAPSYGEIISGFAGYAAETVAPELRYGDAGLKPQMHPAEIGPTALARVHEVIRHLAADEDLIDDWFGRFMTESKRGFYPEPPEDLVEADQLLGWLREGLKLYREPGSRFAFVRLKKGGARLFVGGESHTLSPTLAESVVGITEAAAIDRESLGPWLGEEEMGELLAVLVNEGHLRMEE